MRPRSIGSLFLYVFIYGGLLLEVSLFISRREISPHFPLIAMALASFFCIGASIKMAKKGSIQNKSGRITSRSENPIAFWGRVLFLGATGIILGLVPLAVYSLLFYGNAVK